MSDEANDKTAETKEVSSNDASPPDDDAQPGDDKETETVALTISETNDKPPDYTGEAPPPYKSTDIRGSIKRAKEESSGRLDFGRRVCVAVFCGVACCGVQIAFWLAIPVAMIAVGAIYLHDCPFQRFIPIYLLVGGCFGVLKAILGLIQQLCNKKKGQTLDKQVEETKRPNPFIGILNCFLFAWFIAGCYWVFSIHGDYQSEDPEAEQYCHQVVYLFAFWLLIVSFILAALALLCICGVCIGACIIGKKQASYDLK